MEDGSTTGVVVPVVVGAVDDIKVDAAVGTTSTFHVSEGTVLAEVATPT